MPERKRSKTEEFTEALATNAGRYGVGLRVEDLTQLGNYFERLNAWNARLHLVAPCSPTEFATRHVLESLMAASYLPDGATVIDIGSGAGLPVIPCLIARPDLKAVLIEASPKKAIFLREALRLLERHSAARVIAERFERIAPPEANVLTCRALERFTELLPSMIEWAAKVETLLLFGGPSVRHTLETLALDFDAAPIPASEQRFLFVVPRKS